MSDLIRREDVAEALYQAIRTTLTGTFTDSMSLAIAMANNLPSAEPKRKKGSLKTIGFLTCQCSECGAQFHELEYTNYCPNCGTKWEESQR